MLHYKTDTLDYFFEDKEYNHQDVAKRTIDSILSPSNPQSSCWWSKLKSTINDLKDNKTEILNHHKSLLLGEPSKEVESTVSTAKTCPAILSVLKNSFLVKAPCDIVVSVNSNHEFVADTPGSNLVYIQSHSVKQFHTKDGILNSKTNLKISFPIFIKTNKIPWIFLQPTFHNDVGFDVVNGCVTENYTKAQPLFVNVLVETPKDGEITSLTISKGDVLAYLWFPKKVSLNHSTSNFFLGVKGVKWSNKA